MPRYLRMFPFLRPGATGQWRRLVGSSEQTALVALAETQKREHKCPIHRFEPSVYGAEAGLMPGDTKGAGLPSGLRGPAGDS